MEIEKKPAYLANEVKTESEESSCCAKVKCNCENIKKFWPQIIIAVLLIFIAGGFGYYKLVWKKHNLTQSEARKKATDFINNNLMQGGMKADIGSVTRENGMFKVMVKIGEGKQQQEITSYLSSDGTKFFPNVMDIAETEQKIAEQKKAEAETQAVPATEIPKTNKPVVELFVMSFCPYGNKAEDTLKSVYMLLKNKVDFNFRYIVSSDGNNITSLHGEKEVVQNEREACVLKNYGKDSWINFVTYINTNCGSDGSCWEAGAKTLGINTAKISACVTSSGVALMKTDGKLSAEAGASGSPTMIINGVQTKAVYQYGNSEAYKQVICSAFNNMPAECSKVLGSSTTASEGGSCED